VKPFDRFKTGVKRIRELVNWYEIATHSTTLRAGLGAKGYKTKRKLPNKSQQKDSGQVKGLNIFGDCRLLRQVRSTASSLRPRNDNAK